MEGEEDKPKQDKKPASPPPEDSQIPESSDQPSRPPSVIPESVKNSAQIADLTTPTQSKSKTAGLKASAILRTSQTSDVSSNIPSKTLEANIKHEAEPQPVGLPSPTKSTAEVKRTSQTPSGGSKGSSKRFEGGVTEESVQGQSDLGTFNRSLSTTSEGKSSAVLRSSHTPTGGVSKVSLKKSGGSGMDGQQLDETKSKTKIGTAKSILKIPASMSGISNAFPAAFFTKRSPYTHNPPQPEERRPRIPSPRTPREYIINLREDLADFQESHGLPRTRDYSFVSLGLALAQETVRAVYSVFLMFAELLPILEIVSLILRFALDKLIEIFETPEPTNKLKKIAIFCLEMAVILIPLWILVGTIVLPLVSLMFSILKRMLNLKGGKKRSSVKPKPKAKPKVPVVSHVEVRH